MNTPMAMTFSLINDQLIDLCTLHTKDPLNPGGHNSEGSLYVTIVFLTTTVFLVVFETLSLREEAGLHCAIPDRAIKSRNSITN